MGPGAVLVRAQSTEFLSAHNNERASVGVKALVWDTTLASYAQTYAQQQRDLHSCALTHSGGPYGENLFWTSASTVAPSDAVGAWISEKQYYDYASNTCASGQVCGHYTQVVWANSLRLGCASVACNNNGGTFVICSYDPPGNFVGQWPY